MSVPLHGLMPSPLVPVGSTADAPTPPDGGLPPTRRCGRCLAQFPGDPDADPVVMPEFWMCPPCREALLGKLARVGVPVSPPPHQLTSR